MTQILFEKNGVVSLGAVSNEEDLRRPYLINPPPDDGRCEVCGRHLSELTPFVGLTGEVLVKNFRPDFPLPDEIREVNKRAKKEESIRSKDDFDSWYIANYSEDERKRLYEILEEWREMGCDQVGKSWECRDCFVLDDDEYFERREQRYEEHANE
jgi:hypothetical protein